MLWYCNLVRFDGVFVLVMATDAINLTPAISPQDFHYFSKSHVLS